MKKKNFNRYNAVLFLILIFLIVMITIIAPNFIKPKYFFGVMFKNIVELGLLALPMTMLIISGGIDFSVGSTMILATLVGGIAADRLGPGWGMPVSVLTGLAAGLFNGLLVEKARIPSMVATMSAHFLFTGIGRVITNGDSVYAFPIADVLGTTKFGVFPAQILIFVLFAVAFFYVLKYTTFGRKLYAIGHNRGSVEYSGINTQRICMSLYILLGLMGSLAGMIYLGRFSTIQYNADASINMNVMTIAILGGAAITGGKGTIVGTCIAALIIGTLNSGLTVMNIPIAMQIVVRGVVFVVALSVGTFMEVKDKKIAKR